MISPEIGVELPTTLDNIDGDLKMHNEETVDVIEDDPLQSEPLQTDLSNNGMSHNDLQHDESMTEATVAGGVSEEKVVDEENSLQQTLDLNNEEKVIGEENLEPQKLNLDNENMLPQSLDINNEEKVMDEDNSEPQSLIISDNNGSPQNIDMETIKPEPSNEDVDNEPIVEDEPLICTKPTSLKEESRSTDDSNINGDDSALNGVTDHQIGSPDVKGDEDVIESIKFQEASVEPHVKAQQDLIQNCTPKTELEVALFDELTRKESHVKRLSGEVRKLKTFISKRKQTYKRKRKDEGAPTRALSAYNIFVQDRFSKLAKENEAALKSANSDAQLKRVPPASLVASTGNQWKELPAEDKMYYEDRARKDRQRYDDQMSKYQPPEKQANRKRNKTGYNMFFSAHVIRLKQSETGVPSERGSVARLVGNAWKELSPEDKQYYEREADKQNGMNSGDEDERIAKEEERMPEYPPVPQMGAMDPNMHRQSMPPQMTHASVVHQPGHHDPRVHYPPPAQPHYQAYTGYYDYHQPPPPPPQASQGQRSNQQRPHHPGGGYQYHPSHYPYHEQGQI